MAHVTLSDEQLWWQQQIKRGDLKQWIESYLLYLFREWEAIPDLAAEWADWDEADRLDFDIEWPMREDALQILQRCANEGLMTPAQCERLQELIGLIERNRPTLEQMLAE